MENDVSIEYKNEAAEIAAIFENDPKTVAILPQPFATVVMKKNEGVAEFMNLNDEWDKIDSAKSEDSKLVTGVTVISKRTAAEYEEEGIDIVDLYNEEHKLSATLTEEDPDHTAELIVKQGIIEKEPIAKAALPKCNISFIEGEEMKNALSGYLSVLFEANPKSIGGKMPQNDFFL